MKGLLLKEFLVACESRGLLNLRPRVASSLLSLEDELEEVWRDVLKLHTEGQRKPYAPMATKGEPVLTYCTSLNTSQLPKERSPNEILTSSDTNLLPSTCVATIENEQQTVSLTARIANVESTTAGQKKTPLEFPESSQTANGSRKESHNNTKALSPGSSNSTIPLELLEILTPTLSIMEQSQSPKAKAFLCSTPIGMAVLEKTGSPKHDTSHSTDYSSPEYNLRSIELPSSQGSLFQMSLVTSQCSLAVKSSKHSLNKPQDSCAECSLLETELSSGHEFESDSLVSGAASPGVESQEHVWNETQDSSGDDDSDSKLEQLFSRVKLQTDQKKASKDRKSLSEFIVSDSEEAVVLSDNESIGTAHCSSPGSKSYHTPCTPTMGLIFWGSPCENSCHPSKGKAYTCVKERAPLRNRSNLFLSPGVQKTVPVQPLTTPSAHKHYPRFKNNMLSELYELFNRTVFDSKLSGVEVTWNNRLCTTAGSCQYKGLSISRTAVIELATKVCDTFDRLRDTLVHEMCHAACWVVDGTKKAKHGPLWRAWADKAMTKHPGLKPISRCHDYQISYKYTYKCVRCDYKMGRHSKSVDLRTAKCPCCHSEFELEPRLKTDGTPFAPRRLNSYAQFLKDNYSIVKTSSPHRTHAQILEKVKQLYYQNKEKTPG